MALGQRTFKAGRLASRRSSSKTCDALRIGLRRRDPLLRTRSTDMSETMMTAGFDEMVRTRAYALWESEGRPLGRDAEHWLQSEEEARRELQRTAPVKA